MLTGNKDVNRKILNELEDKDLVNVCQTNKNANSICNDQVFWMNRVFNRFSYVGGDVLRKYKGDRSWSEYYIQDLRKINKDNTDEYLQEAAKNNRLDHVMIALEKGANIHMSHDQALRYSSNGGYLDVVKFLVKKGANIHAVEDYALRSASSYGHLDTVKYLVEFGADIHARNNQALKYAKGSKHLEIVKYLESLN